MYSQDCWITIIQRLSLVFCNTKKMVDELAYELCGRGYSAEGLHGDMKQVQRDRVMKNFRNGKTDILIATDVAARGIDVDDVEAVLIMICLRMTSIMYIESAVQEEQAAVERHSPL